jgi:hypothetical protein
MTALSAGISGIPAWVPAVAERSMMKTRREVTTIRLTLEKEHLIDKMSRIVLPVSLRDAGRLRKPDSRRLARGRILPHECPEKKRC